MTIHVDLLGTETRFIDTGKYTTRAISAPGSGEHVFLLHGGGGHAERDELGALNFKRRRVRGQRTRCSRRGRRR